MIANAFKNLDAKKWFDRMHPQTLAIAVWLLYFDGFFSTLQYLDNRDIYMAFSRNSISGVLALLSCLSFVLGGYLMANGKKFGWYVAVAASFSPFVLRLLAKLQWPEMSLTWVVRGNDLISFAFEVALCALLLHNMSRSYVERWLR